MKAHQVVPMSLHLGGCAICSGSSGPPNQPIRHMTYWSIDLIHSRLHFSRFLLAGFYCRCRVRARIIFHVWVLKCLSGKARGLRILLRMERTSNAARRDVSTPKHGKLFLRGPLVGIKRQSLNDGCVALRVICDS